MDPTSVASWRASTRVEPFGGSGSGDVAWQMAIRAEILAQS